MKNRTLKRLLALLLAVSLAVPMTGCTVKGKQVFFSTGSGLMDVFRIGSLQCPESEVKTYIANYRNIFGSIDGKSLWSMNLNTDRLSENIKKGVLERLTLIYSLNLYAKDTGMELDDTDQERAASAAAKYYQSLSKADKEYIGASEKDFAEMYERLILANRVYSGMIGEIEEAISEDEARVVRVQAIFVSDQKKAKKVAKALQKGKGFMELVSKFSERDAAELDISRKNSSPDLWKAAFGMEEGTLSDAIEADGGYYFLRVISKYDIELSDENRERMTEERKKAELDKIAQEQNKKSYSELNKLLWNKMEVPEDKAIKTNKFFSIIKKIMKQ